MIEGVGPVETPPAPSSTVGSAPPLENDETRVTKTLVEVLVSSGVYSLPVPVLPSRGSSFLIGVFLYHSLGRGAVQGPSKMTLEIYERGTTQPRPVL